MPANENRPKAPPKSKYTDEVREVARATRETLGEKVKAPGAKQVAAVVKVLGDRVPAEVAGISSARLRKWAVEAERPEEYAKLRELASQVGDPWATGRKLAAILVSVEVVRKASQ
ncbi:MAG TPA: hypothetical protein VHU86_01375 [Solirubrobacterales bacterium]|jgi:hypothetical protein|nr:hypothetical protein [Solirubrobacterales bacterium]